MPSNISDRLKRVFGEDSFEWFSKSYLFDWLCVAILWVLAFYAKTIPVTQRDFSVDDPLIQHEHRKNQVSSPFNQFMALVVPSTVIIVACTVQRSLVGVHHGVIGLLTTRALSTLVTRFLKNRIGRLRPDFLTRCEWDAAVKACTGKEKDITEGRRSFPSGHSATAFSGMFYLSLFIAGQTAAWCFSANRFSPRILSSRVLRFALTLVPLTWAAHVALSRMEDNRHHKEDVIVGSLIGVSSALICYSMFWPNPFSARNFGVEDAGQPRYLYNVQGTSRRVEFELAAMDDETNPV
ncbi:lipid phosphate phosphatase 1 [Coprinopsis sp. MPI-PUGE-AT-0042]|nr:lipid phosphate phosphatase 1 [Coprinopsis sp. MPI-PUGE-AT-0042]